MQRSDFALGSALRLSDPRARRGLPVTIITQITLDTLYSRYHLDPTDPLSELTHFAGVDDTTSQTNDSTIAAWDDE